MKYKAYRFEYEWADGSDWGWDVIEALNFRSAKKWIFEHYPKDEFTINYIAEIKYEKEEEK